VFLTALLPRLAIALAAPGTGGDTEVYRAVAGNILRNFCVSLSDPAGGLCELHWGGNQLPGFPAFMALVHGVSGGSDTAILVAQSVLVALAAAYLAVSLREYLGSTRRAVPPAFLVALSPLGIPSTRFFLTEGLTLAITIWLFAELIRSLAERRLRIVPLGVAFTLAVFVRYDSALLAFPVALAAFVIHPPLEAVRRGATLSLIAALPLAVWWARSIALGLAPVPTVGVLPGDAMLPSGYISWGNGWVTHQYQNPGWRDPVYLLAHSKIRIDPRAYDGKQERARVEALLAQVAAYDGQAFPDHIDEEFAALAAEKAAANPLRHWILRPLERTTRMWFNPYNSSGWPVSLDTLEMTGSGGVGDGVWALVVSNPLRAMVKGSTAVYRVGLIVAGLSLLVWSLSRAPPPFRAVIWLAALYAASKTVFLNALVLVESRYLIGTVPMLEVAVALGVSALWIQRRRRRRCRLATAAR
jgi:hypothetical protein